MNLKLATLLFLLPFLLKGQNNIHKELTQLFYKDTIENIQTNRIPGLAIGIIHNNQVVFKKGYGLADTDKQTPINSKTGFNVGSISKMFTAWGIMTLVEENKIHLDSPVVNYITSWTLPQSNFNTNKITVRNLLQHTAGLSVHGYNGYKNKEELSSIQESLDGKSNPEEQVKPIMEPETKWQYSGGGYSILQLLIEEITQQPFSKYMHKTIFKPLKMKHTSFSIDKCIIKNSSKAHDENGQPIELRLFNAQAAAGLHTTLEDLILFAKASLNKNPVLTQHSIKLLRLPTELSNGNYGMGYMVMNRFGDFTLSGHGGSNEGWQSGFMLDFKTNSGIIILTNSSAGKSAIFYGMKRWSNWYTNQLEKRK